MALCVQWGGSAACPLLPRGSIQQQKKSNFPTNSLSETAGLVINHREGGGEWNIEETACGDSERQANTRKRGGGPKGPSVSPVQDGEGAH